MSPRPRVSVVMSVCDGADHLATALDSILMQTWTDFEFLVVDDGSRDTTPEILHAYAARDARIRVLRNEHRQGLTRSLNRALQEARGVFVARQDADDVSLPERLSRQVAYLEMHPDVGLVGSAVEIIDEVGQPLAIKTPPTDHDAIRARLLINNCMVHTSVMFRRDVVWELGGYNESLAYAQDYDLWWRLARRTRLAALRDVLARWRRGASITTRRRRTQLAAAFRISLRAVRDSMGEQNLDTEAYSLFWWALHGDGRALQGLDPGVIRRLASFWHFLAGFPQAPETWGPRFRQFGYRCLRQRLIRTGLAILWRAWRYLGAPPDTKSLFRGLVGVLSPIRKPVPHIVDHLEEPP